MARHNALTIGLVCCAATLGGCATGSRYKPPSLDAYGLATAAKDVALKDVAARRDAVVWWGDFNDPTLTELAAAVAAENLDIAQASARLRAARAGLDQARAGFLPSLSASLSSGSTQTDGGPTRDTSSGRVDARWTLDLFGGERRAAEAARASMEQADYSLENVRVVVLSEMGRAYVTQRALTERIRIARESLATQDDNLEIVQFRQQAGLATPLDQEQARAQRAAIAATLPSLMQAELNARTQLAVLAGVAPTALDTRLLSAGPIPAVAGSFAIEAPASAVRQRADVLAAERQLAAATARVGVAQAQLYPSFTLSGTLSSSAASLGGVGDVVARTTLAALAGPVFQGGALRAQVRQRRASAEEALAFYQETVLRALQEAVVALANLDATRVRMELSREQLSAAVSAAEVARSSYRAGRIDFLRLLDAERSLLSAQDALIQARADETTAYINAYVAFGGAWSPGAATQEPENAQ